MFIWGSLALSAPLIFDLAFGVRLFLVFSSPCRVIVRRRDHFNSGNLSPSHRLNCSTPPTAS